jgi:hypothetical protein
MKAANEILRLFAKFAHQCLDLPRRYSSLVRLPQQASDPHRDRVDQGLLRLCYLYGPVCIAESERGLGVALALFEVLQKHMAGRPAMTFVRTDNAPSRRAHQKMGMRELGIFLSEDVLSL